MTHSSHDSLLSDPLQIRVRGLDGKAVEVTVKPEFTVFDVKELLCHGWCQYAEGSVSKVLGVPPPHVKLMLGCKEFDDSSSLESLKIRSGMTLDLFPCYLSATQVYVQKDWDRVASDGRPRFIPQPWICQNGRTARHLKEWIAEVCGIEKDGANDIDVALEYANGVVIDNDDFANWESRPSCGFDGSLVLTAFKYDDAIEPCPDSLQQPTTDTSAMPSRIAELEALTSSRIIELEALKKQAVEREDYAAAFRFKEMIDSAISCLGCSHGEGKKTRTGSSKRGGA